MKFKISEKICTGCMLCQTVCSYEKYSLINLKRSRVHILFNTNNNKPKIVICRQCNVCKCISACKYGAFKKNNETGEVYIDNEICQACFACVDACPFHAVSIDNKEKLPNVCDLCNGDPQCVKACVSGAITMIE